jgi:hypothetical protein
MGEAMKPVLVLIVCALAIFPQRRDFLTADEVDQVRLAQEPNARLKLYVSFARQRIALIEQLIAGNKSGRSGMIHETLDDYTKIIEAVDTVASDALKRKLPIDEGIKAVAEAEKEMLAALKKIEESEPKDLARYRFALTQAIETTEDSAELASQDIKERTAEVIAKEDRDRKEREARMQPKDLEELRATEKKEAETQQKRKAPTLRRKGEVAPKKP